MARLQDQRKSLASLKSVGRCTVSCIFVLLTQFSLSLVPRFFYASPFLLQLALSALLLLVVLGFCRWCRRLIGFYVSTPAFVFFNIIIIWSFYVFVVRKAVSSLMDALFNGEVVMMMIGLYRIQSRDPGLVLHESTSSDKVVQISNFGFESHNENSLSLKRIRYCKSCKAYIKGFDHHCPAFGNCIGQNNYILFMVLLIGFLTIEASYLVCSSQFVTKSRNFGRNWIEIDLVGNLVISTMLFSILHALWQGVFLMWHVYCICFNVRTDEWINWKKYPEFQVVYSEPGESFTRMMFRNPYDKGILQNVKDFLVLRG